MAAPPLDHCVGFSSGCSPQRRRLIRNTLPNYECGFNEIGIGAAPNAQSPLLPTDRGKKQHGAMGNRQCGFTQINHLSENPKKWALIGRDITNATKPY